MNYTFSDISYLILCYVANSATSEGFQYVFEVIETTSDLSTLQFKFPSSYPLPLEASSP
jgi:hypothetical protein